MASPFYCDTFCFCRTNIMDGTFTQVFCTKLLRFMLVHTHERIIVNISELLLIVRITVLLNTYCSYYRITQHLLFVLPCYSTLTVHITMLLNTYCSYYCITQHLLFLFPCYSTLTVRITHHCSYYRTAQHSSCQNIYKVFILFIMFENAVNCTV